MRRHEPRFIIVKKTEEKYSIHNIEKQGYLNREKGTIIVKNPFYNPRAAEEFLYFHPKEVELVYEEREKQSWYEWQKQRQDEAGTKDRIAD